MSTRIDRTRRWAKTNRQTNAKRNHRNYSFCWNEIIKPKQSQKRSKFTILILDSRFRFISFRLENNRSCTEKKKQFSVTSYAALQVKLKLKWMNERNTFDQLKLINADIQRMESDLFWLLSMAVRRWRAGIFLVSMKHESDNRSMTIRLAKWKTL